MLQTAGSRLKLKVTLLHRHMLKKALVQPEVKRQSYSSLAPPIGTLSKIHTVFTLKGIMLSLIEPPALMYRLNC